MTEEEAKGKWCPFARVSEYIPEREASEDGAVGHVMGFNRVQGCKPNGEEATIIPGAAQCIGSGCMAWKDDGDVWSEVHDKYITMGRCGMVRP